MSLLRLGYRDRYRTCAMGIKTPCASFTPLGNIIRGISAPKYREEVINQREQFIVLLRTCSARRNPINVIEVQKMKEQFYVMLRTGFERKLKNEGG